MQSMQKRSRHDARKWYLCILCSPSLLPFDHLQRISLLASFTMPLPCIGEFWTYSHISFVLGIIIWSFLKAVVFSSMLADSHTADYNGHSIQTTPVSRVILFKIPVSVQLQAARQSMARMLKY